MIPHQTSPCIITIKTSDLDADETYDVCDCNAHYNPAYEPDGFEDLERQQTPPNSTTQPTFWTVLQQIILIPFRNCKRMNRVK